MFSPQGSTMLPHHKIVTVAHQSAPERLLVGAELVLKPSQKSGLENPGCTKLIFDGTFWSGKVSHGTDLEVKVSLHKLFWGLGVGHRKSIAAF